MLVPERKHWRYRGNYDARDMEALAHLLDQIVHHAAGERIETARRFVVNEMAARA